ncbi:MAG: hypothetical protein QOJ73_330 [Streptosporangiaceae bacterium]|jgi:hypothetical protein|nr:hypothetical protein [Streptosporangiaceae bacterium]
MSIVISFVALALSLSVFLHGRWRDRRDLILRIHEHLITADQQRGRRLLYAMTETRVRVEDLSEDDYVSINNALASLNVLGIYYQRRYVRRKDALELWGLPVVRALLAGDTFIAHRDAEQGMNSWPQLRAFAEDARKYAQRQGVTVQVSGGIAGKLRPPVEG